MFLELLRRLAQIWQYPCPWHAFSLLHYAQYLPIVHPVSKKSSLWPFCNATRHYHSHHQLLLRCSLCLAPSPLLPFSHSPVAVAKVRFRCLVPHQTVKVDSQNIGTHRKGAFQASRVELPMNNDTHEYDEV